MKLNTINNTDNWGATTNRLNSNFEKIDVEVAKLTHETTNSKGLFPTEVALKAAYPTPKVGDWAIVGNTIPGLIWHCVTAGTWVNSGQTGGGGSVPLDDYLKISDITSITDIL